MDQQPVKKAWLSKTMWINLFVAIVGVIAAFVPGASVVTEWLSSHGDIVAMVFGLVNLILRATTKDKLEFWG